ncbi:lysine N(6)-hydroxylase/L-ornithine N(5)-oxygenase family protein [Actinomadura harenae]|uniref:L-lysine N6-monooxygenase MbtG n=1 Tax=Actinomadura harenae TaxID=2483351 RepID=A0A3M2MD74_9ACTN|nr:SidA/IucD/PvdA family monooxygenase [Actinomadura harenae]RMI47489.1 L-lysine 6-monooxygenase [Actinomadura harenae]
MSEIDIPHHHTVGVGAGPANLSLAALFEAVAPHRLVLLERRPVSTWHPRLLLSGVRMQTSWLKDLVSLVDPTHRLSFVNYLVSSGRIYALINAQFNVIPRREYQRYLAWASEQIEGIEYGVSVDEIGFEEGVGFSYESGGRTIARSDHLVLGLGSVPYVPPGLSGIVGDDAFVPEELTGRLPDMDREAPVSVIGGGQTGAECVLELLGHGFTDVTWLGRRPWFQPMDDSPPANDFYRPAYVEFLQQVTRETRRRLIEGQTLTGDAITPGALQSIYQANYDGMLRLDRYPLTMRPGRDVTSADRDGDGFVLSATSPIGHEKVPARYVVLATGRTATPPPLAPSLTELIDHDDTGEMIVDSDYSLRWKGSDRNKIFVQNRARYTHGVADANLTLLPVRAATIINSLFERDVYTVRDAAPSVVWG